VGTATFVEPTAAARIVAEMRAWLAANGIARVAELRGRFVAAPAQSPTPEESTT
jgi:dihydroorotate dehydrogenase